MRVSFFLLSIPALVSAAKCNADNCARALTGTVDGLARPSSRINTDCSSFQLMTVYPAATTTTITSGSSTTTILPDMADITVAPFLLPAYAKAACTPGSVASARFASACSCAGVTESTTTAAVPVATLIVPSGTNGIPYCSAPGSAPGSDGCSGNCYCDARAGTETTGVCDSVVGQCSVAPHCTTDADCKAGNVCISPSSVLFCDHSFCVGYADCSSSFIPAKRSLFGRAMVDIDSVAAPLVKKEAKVLTERGDAVSDRPDQN